LPDFLKVPMVAMISSPWFAVSITAPIAVSMAIEGPEAIDAASEGPQHSGGWRAAGFLASRGMGAAQGKKVG
jgi:hypothetical protein